MTNRAKSHRLSREFTDTVTIILHRGERRRDDSVVAGTAADVRGWRDQDIGRPAQRLTIVADSLSLTRLSWIECAKYRTYSLSAM